MVEPKSSIATRREIKVPKKPLASWTRLVAMISVVICARIRPLDCIGSPFIWRSIKKATATKFTHLVIFAPRRIHSRPKGPIIVTWSVGELPSYAPAGLVYADVKPAVLFAGFGGAFGRSA